MTFSTVGTLAMSFVLMIICKDYTATVSFLLSRKFGRFFYVSTIIKDSKYLVNKKMKKVLGYIILFTLTKKKTLFEFYTP